MRFTSMEAASAWVASLLKQRMRENVTAMMADGWTQEEAEATMNQGKDVGQLHCEIMTQIERIISEPNAPSYRDQ